MATRYGGPARARGRHRVDPPARRRRDRPARGRRPASRARSRAAPGRGLRARARRGVLVTRRRPPRASRRSRPRPIKPLSALSAMASGMSAELRSIFSTIERELVALREAKGAAVLRDLHPADGARQRDRGRSGAPGAVPGVRVGAAREPRRCGARRHGRPREPRHKRGSRSEEPHPRRTSTSSRARRPPRCWRGCSSPTPSRHPKEGHVTVTVEAGQGASLVVEDDGTAIPEDACSAPGLDAARSLPPSAAPGPSRSTGPKPWPAASAPRWKLGESAPS